MAFDVDSAPPPTSRPVWLALFGAPLAWVAQALVVWILVGTACRMPPATASVPMRGLTLATTIAGGIVAVIAAMVSADAWRGSRDPGIAHLRSRTRGDFIAAAALLVSVSFLIAILLTGFAAVMLDLCQVTR